MTDKPVLRGVADALQPMLDEISKIGKSVTEFANGPGPQALKAFAKARSAPMTDQPETHTLAEAEVIARAVSPLNWWAGEVMAELDRVREALNQRLDPIETALEAQLGVAEERIWQRSAELAEAKATIARLEAERDQLKRESNGFCNANAEKLVEHVRHGMKDFTSGVDPIHGRLEDRLVAAVEEGNKEARDE